MDSPEKTNRQVGNPDMDKSALIVLVKAASKAKMSAGKHNRVSAAANYLEERLSLIPKTPTQEKP